MVINNATSTVEFFPFVTFDDVAAGAGGSDEYLLQQDGSFILQQDGSKIISAAAGGSVDVQVWHKNTKTLAEGTSGITQTGSKIRINLPSLTTIADVADDLDTVLIRVLYEDALKWEYVATWSTESTNINKEFKSWDTVDTEAPTWITI